MVAPNIFYITPFSSSKHYGRELNKHIEPLPDNCWIVVRDLDTMVLSPNTGNLIEQAIIDNPKAELITTNTNRVWGSPLNSNSDIVWHIKKAHQLESEKDYQLIEGVIPAFCWIFPKSTWSKMPFDDLPILHPPNNPNSFDVR